MKYFTCPSGNTSGRAPVLSWPGLLKLAAQAIGRSTVLRPSTDPLSEDVLREAFANLARGM